MKLKSQGFNNQFESTETDILGDVMQDENNLLSNCVTTLPSPPPSNPLLMKLPQIAPISPLKETRDDTNSIKSTDESDHANSNAVEILLEKYHEEVINLRKERDEARKQKNELELKFII